MTGKTKKIILLSTAVLVFAAGFIGYKLYNKKHFSVEGSTPAATITAAALYQTFTTDSVVAKGKFIGDETNQKVIQVQGEIANLQKDQQGNTIILLKTAVAGAFINCTLERKAENINASNSIALKGICSGYNFDADMGVPGDVILVRCFLTK
jgi:tRNA_anti-like